MYLHLQIKKKSESDVGASHENFRDRTVWDLWRENRYIWLWFSVLPNVDCRSLWIELNSFFFSELNYAHITLSKWNTKMNLQNCMKIAWTYVIVFILFVLHLRNFPIKCCFSFALLWLKCSMLAHKWNHFTSCTTYVHTVEYRWTWTPNAFAKHLFLIQLQIVF